MSAANYDIITQEGAGLSLTLVYKDDAGTPIDISTYAPQINVTDNAQDDTADTYVGAFVTDGTDGAFNITITPAQVETWLFRNGRYTIELDAVSGLVLVYGKLQVRNLPY